MKDLHKTVTYRIHHRDGHSYEVGEDPDGLGCVAITYLDENTQKSLVIGREEALEVAQAIHDVLRFLTARDS